MNGVREYLQRLGTGLASGWEHFWFTPQDVFTLCVLRIAAGVASLYYVGSHSADLLRWFGPEGILNPSTIITLTGAHQPSTWYRFSYLFLADSPTSLWILHVVGILVLLMWTVGVWSRVTNVAALVVVLSYVHRGPILTGQFEPVLTMVVAYLCLAPTGRCLSWDAWRERYRPLTPRQLLSGRRLRHVSVGARIAARLIQLHLVGLSATIGLNMLSADVWWSGEAVWWILARSESRLVDLTGLSDWFLWVNAWTHAIVAYQLSFAILVWNPLARPLLLTLGVIVWTSLALITGLVAWSAMMVIASLAFVDPHWLREVVRCPVPDGGVT